MPSPLQDTIHVSGYPSPDSLAGTDTLAGMPDTILFSGADTLQTAPAEIWDAAAVYGPDSAPITVNAIAEAAAALSAMTENHLFRLLSLAVLILYCWMVYAFREQAKLCLKGLADFKAEERFSIEHGRFYNRFLNFAVAVAIVGAGIFVVKLISGTTAADIESAVPKWLLQPAALLVSAVMAVILTFQFGVLKAAGKLTFSEDMTEAVAHVKKQHLATAALLITPAALMYTGTNPAWDSILVYISAIVAFALTLTFAAKTFTLFIRQKVSILVWILYLCAVEIMPLSLAVLMAAKNI